MFWRVFSAALLLVSAVVVLGQDETPPVSPCPAVYGYGWNPVTGWHGQISINPPLQFSEVRLTVRLSLPYYRPEAGVGHVEIKGGDRAVQEISTKAIRGIRQTIRFLVIFPPFKQLPRITSVKINGREFCPAQQMYPDSRASIELKYTLKSGLDLPVDNGNSFSVTGSQPSRPAQPSQTDVYVIEVVQVSPENEARPSLHQSTTKPLPQPITDAIVFIDNPTSDQYNPSTPSHGSSKPRPVSSKPVSSKPEPVSSKPRPVSSKPVSSKPVSSNPDPVSSNPDPVSSKPDPSHSAVNTQDVDEKVLQLLAAISKGETVASSRVEKLLQRLIVLTTKRYHTELERLSIEKERLALEVEAIKEFGIV